MNNPKMSCCYFPTTIVLLDDRLDFLRSMALKLNSQLNYKLYDNPSQALEFLTTNCRQSSFAKKWFSIVEDGEFENSLLAHSAVNVNIFAIHQEVYNKTRFNELSVLLVDYAMPNINGVEFCRKLQDLPIKKLLMTGEADHSLAVQAFNDHIIDQFVLKEEKDFFGQINKAVRELQKKYFHDLSKSIMENLLIDSNNCLGDEVFINFFHQLCEENNIVEYYLIDDLGGFLMFDIEGNPNWLIVKIKKNIEGYYHIAEDNDASRDIIEDLANYRKIPFFFSEEDQKEPVNNWDKYLHSTNVIEGKNKYYYTFIKDKSIYKIRHNDIYSYQEFLASL